MNQAATVSGTAPTLHGHLAKEWCGKLLPLQVLQSQRGYYVGTAGEEGPVSRESNEYFRTDELARQALQDGNWTQKQEP
ncbi:hypothetical protein [Acidovorax sp. SUPP2825]|uniref:hypothetical protein n=1 Tax=Acidovorax sp. SUPP2825 TaxID=2920879 RepID=UPI0023DE6351|nr:hypothetical protein [Acidovorax sp. SUPP2825]GKS97435.1 hypothetical protein AVAK2825_22890 [Acidovorax sp. SUPP2825]